MFLPLFIVVFTNVVNLILLMFVLKRRERNSDRLLYGVFAGSIIFLVLWSVANYLADTSTTTSEALFWTRATFPPSLMMCWFVFYFSYLFPLTQMSKKAVVVYGILTLILGAASMGSGVVARVELDPAIGVSGVEVGSTYEVTVVLYLVLILHATYMFARNLFILRGKQRQQVRSVLIGWSSFLLFAVTTNAVLPLITGNADWSKFGPLGSIVMVFFISYAIVRHGFLNIKVIIQRGIVYSILLAIITGIYISVLFVGQLLFHGSSDTSILVSAFVTTIIGIFGVPPLHHYFRKVTATIFFKDAYDYASVLQALADVLNKNLAQDSIIRKTTDILVHALTPEKIIFYLKDATPPEGYALTIPIRGNKKHIGTLLLGDKRSGDAYTYEDVRLLETFCSQAAVALEKAALYKQVKEYAETLEKKVEERTAEIHAIQKEQESMMLEISHGLQTPLTIMKGELSLLRKKGYETNTIDTMDSSIDRISAFIYKLLGMYRRETTGSHEYTRVELGELIKASARSFNDHAQTKNARITLDIDDEAFVRGDRDELEEVFTNLISNAIKYSDPQKPNNILITCRTEGETVVATITDTGIGIREENIPQLFSKFYRIKDTRAKGVQGTGLGLAVVKQIVEKHGGTVSVTSIYGEGITCTVVLPRNDKKKAGVLN